MDDATTAATMLGRLPLAWPYPLAGAGVGTSVHVLGGAGCAGRSQKRFAMASTRINGWPPGPSDGSP